MTQFDRLAPPGSERVNEVPTGAVVHFWTIHDTWQAATVTAQGFPTRIETPPGFVLLTVEHDNTAQAGVLGIPWKAPDGTFFLENAPRASLAISHRPSSKCRHDHDAVCERCDFCHCVRGGGLIRFVSSACVIHHGGTSAEQEGEHEQNTEHEEDPKT